MNRTTATRITTLAALAVVAGLAGCSAPTDPARDCLTQPLPPAPGALVLLVGVHANAPAPALPASAAPALQAALAAGNPVTVIGVDGTPATIAVQANTAVARSTCDAFRAGLAAATNAVIDTITSAAADSDGADLFTALDVAGKTVRTGGWSNATILVIDSGLTERPGSPINFTQPGMTTLTAKDVEDAADFAITTQHLDLAGTTVQFHGLAATAPPQTALSPAEAQVVTSLWVHTARRAGADPVTATPTPRTGPGPTTRFVTTLIPTVEGSTFQPPTPRSPTQATFGEQDIHFGNDSATITDPNAATTKLAQLTAWLAANPKHMVALHGRTDSSGTPEHNTALADRRATAVKTLILTAAKNAGTPINPAQILTFADGENFTGALPDNRPDGTLDPGPAAKNRHVLAIATTS